MINLKESLLELASANAERALTAGSGLAGGEAIARLALLMSLLDTLDASDGDWEDCALLPEISGSPMAMGPSPDAWQH